MKTKFGIRALSVLLTASMVSSASLGMASAKNASAERASYAQNGNVSDTSAVSATESAVSIPRGIVLEGDHLDRAGEPAGLAGDGTVQNPYQITSFSDLLLMSDFINYSNSGNKNFKLMNNISLASAVFPALDTANFDANSSFKSYDGIYAIVSAMPSLSGNANVYFNFDGNGKTISGLNVAVPNGVTAAAVFGYVNVNSSIRNLNLDGCTINVGNSTNGAIGLVAVQNFGTISGCTVSDSAIDLRPASVSASTEADYFTASAGNIYKGYAFIAADNIGTISDCTVTGSNNTKGIFLKGNRRFAGCIVGQNRKVVSDCTVSGVRLLAFGSTDSNDSISGNGTVASYIGMIAGRNNAKAGKTSYDGEITGCSVTFSYGSDMLFGDYVGGIAGANGGRITDSQVNGGFTSYGSLPSSETANMYGFGRFGGIAGANTGTISSTGAYGVGFFFSKQSDTNAFGGIAGFNSGTVTGCAASGAVNINSITTAGAGGILGNVQPGSTLSNNYAFVRISTATDNSGAVLGKNGTTSYLGQNNFWSSGAAGITYAIPNGGIGQNDLVGSISVVNVEKGSSGTDLDASSMRHAWNGGAASVIVDLNQAASVSNSDIHVANTSSGFHLSSTIIGAFGQMNYFVKAVLPSGVGVHGKNISFKLSVPVIVSEEANAGAGTSAANPIIIQTYEQFKFIASAPNASYRLGADITVNSGDWSPIAFGGTLDGDGHTLTVAETLFTDVTGTRNSDIASPDWTTDVNNLSKGYISNLKIVASDCVTGGVFRNVTNATLVNVEYSADQAGYTLINSARAGAFINTLSGNIYLNRCYVSVPVTVTSGSSDGIAAFVGYVSANAIKVVDCGTSSMIAIQGNNLNNVGGLFGNIASVTTVGAVESCFASGCVYMTSSDLVANANIVVGAESQGAASKLTFADCYYSIAESSVNGGVVSKNAAPYTTGISELSFAQNAYNLSTDGTATQITLSMPTGITLCGDMSASDFSLAFGSSAVAQCNPAASVSGADYIFNVHATGSGDFSTTMTATHVPTGLKATLILRSGLRTVDGYYEIYTVADLQEIANGFTQSPSKYVSANYKLCADLDLTGISLPKMATTNANAFTGAFVGKEKNDGTKYAIKNLEIVGTGAASGTYTTACGLFCYAKGATFRNFAMHNVSATNSGIATGLIVGMADYSSATTCIFEDIEIIDCSVMSTRTAAASITPSFTNVSLAGSVVGSLQSTQAGGDGYTFDNILVKDTIVGSPNNSSGTASIGGLIGDSRASCVVHVGAVGDQPSVVLDHVTVTGYTFIGGVIGSAGKTIPVAAGTNTSINTAQTSKDGINIQNVLVTDCTIQAGMASVSNSQGGLVGGIIGTETVGVGNASVSNCTVRNTTIESGYVMGSSELLYYGDTGGVAGHYSGTVSDCTVDSCTIASCAGGGIVGRPSRKGSTTAQTLLTVQRCKVLGNTRITIPDKITSVTKAEAGGLVASAKYAALSISDCGVGPDVTVEGLYLYCGGMVGAVLATTSATATSSNYTLTLQNCVSYASVYKPGVLANSAVGGAVGSLSCPPNSVTIQNCVIAGHVDNNNSYAGGILGVMANSGSGTTLIENCAVSALINQRPDITTTTYNTAKILCKVTSSYAGWMAAASIGNAIKGVIVSSYPQDCNRYGTVSNATTLIESKTGFSNTYYDLNTYYELDTDLNESVKKYLDELTGNFVIDGSQNENPKTMSIKSANNTVYSPDSARAVFYDQTDASKKLYHGWKSNANGVMEVTDESTATAVKILAHKSASAVGVVGSFYLPGYTVPGTTDSPVLLDVMVPVECKNIAPTPLDGSGTPESPYLIRTKADLDSIRNRDKTKCYALANNIVFEPSDFEMDGDYYNNGNKFIPIDLTVSDSESSTENTKFSFTGRHNGETYYIEGLQIGGSSAYAALFACADGAEFTDIYLDKFDVQTSGGYGAGLVAKAENNTVLKNIQVHNSSFSASEYAGSVAAYVTDTTAENIVIENVQVKDAYYVGGLFGHAHHASTPESDTIKNVEITNVSASSYAPNSSSDTLLYKAAGVVGEFSGRMNDVTISGSGTISGSLASGVVAYVYDSTDSTDSTDSICSIRNVRIDGAYTITSARSSNAAAAAGILAKIRKDQGEDSNQTSPKAVDVSISDCFVGEDVCVNAYFYAGGVLGSSDMHSRGSIAIQNTDSFAQVNGRLDNPVDGVAAAVAAHVSDLNTLSITNCNASGTVNGAKVAAGLIGVADGKVFTSGSFVSDCTVSAALSTNGNAADAEKLTGAVIGRVGSQSSTLVLPGDLQSSPINRVYYSDFQLGADIAQIGNMDVEAYQATFCNLQPLFTYSDGSSSLPLTENGLVLDENSIRIAAPASGAVTGNYKAFTANNGVDFELKDIFPQNALNEQFFTYSADMDTLTLTKASSGQAVFQYTNGVCVALSVSASDISGTGTAGDPYIIEKISHLSYLSNRPNKYFELGTDLDFAEGEGAEDWPAAWTEWFKNIAFTGSLDGKGYAIRNLSIESSETNVGFFAVLDGTVTDLVFESCSFTSTAQNGNAGTLAGKNKGTVSEIVVTDGSVSAPRHAGGVVGFSYGSVEECTVSSGTTVESGHCAGGIVGSGTNVTGCTVDSVTVSATMPAVAAGDLVFAGGICGATGSFNDETEFESSVQSAHASAVYEDCEVRATSVTATSAVRTDELELYVNTRSFAGGIVGNAEDGVNGVMRSITINGCYADNATTVSATSPANNGNGDRFGNAGGMLGFLATYYDGFVVRNCETYATVSAYGGHASQYSTAAGGLLGSTAYADEYTSNNYRLYRSGEPTFSMLNNVCSGKIRSAYYAGGLVGRFSCYFGPGSNGTIGSGDFASGNIISSTFEQLDKYEALGARNSGDLQFGLFMGYCASQATMLNGVTPKQVMRYNYYSSYVCNRNNESVTAFGSLSGTSVCGLYDVAVSETGRSSFQVKNNNLLSDGTLSSLDDANFTELVNGYHFEDLHLSNEYTKPVRLCFDIRTADEKAADPESSAYVAPNPSTDLGALNSSFTVFTGEDAHILQLLDLTIDSDSNDYESTLTTYNDELYASAFTINRDPESTEPASPAKLVADIGYGLKIGINISATGDVYEDGSPDYPYLIPDAWTFVHYFFSDWATDAHTYLSNYYLQTADIVFDGEDGIAAEIEALNQPDVADEDKVKFAPIGTELKPFNGGYDGGSFKISGFSYSGSDKDMGLFGYVSDAQMQYVADYHVRNLHIELDVDGVVGGNNVGGLAGTYNSVMPVKNCSVVYGSVKTADNYGTEDLNAGGLFGKMTSATLDGCFTSTDVCSFANYNGSNTGAVGTSAGGLVGIQIRGGNTTGNLVFNNCFSSSDVVSPYCVGGFLGRVEDNSGVVLRDCVCTASATAMKQVLSPVNKPTSLVIGYKIGYDDAAFSNTTPYILANNVYVAGPNATEYRPSRSNQFLHYPELFGTVPLMPDSDHVYYDATVIGRISIPNSLNDNRPFIRHVNGDTYEADDRTVKFNENGSITTSSTLELTSPNFNSKFPVIGDDGTRWDCSDTELYPVLLMYDEYSDIFAKLSALPVFLDSREADDITTDRKYAGVTYPVTISKTISLGENNNVNLTISSSKYSEGTDEIDYNEKYDVNLHGNGTDKQTDFLFRYEEDRYVILRNSYLCYDTTAARDEKSPVVTLKATVNGEEYCRSVRIPLRGENNAVFVSTERQLRAIENSKLTSGNYAEYRGKFHDAYGSACSKNIMVCADIDLNPKLAFNPIDGYVGNSHSGDSDFEDFEGSNCVIRNMVIDEEGNNVGLFSSLEQDGLKVQNVILSNVNVKGGNHTGALAGSVSTNVLINNCMAISENGEISKVKGAEYVGGLIGSMEGSFVGYQDVSSEADNYTKGQVSGANVEVSGTNYVGGFAGSIKNSTIANAFATGDVEMTGCTFTVETQNEDNYGAVGGFAGYVSVGDLDEDKAKIIQYAFASGDVRHLPSETDDSDDEQNLQPISASTFAAKIGVGGFVGVSESRIEKCFSSGDVYSGTTGYSAESNISITHAIGGLVGYSAEGGVQYSYSSSLVSYDAPTAIPSYVTSAIGGVVGYSEEVGDNNVLSIYSSGSISPSIVEGTDTISVNPDKNSEAESAKIYYGGAVGFAGNDNTTNVKYVYFDKWTNNIENLKAVGNMNDSQGSGDSDSETVTADIAGITTDQFCSGALIPSKLVGAQWGYDDTTNSNTYPYLKDFCKWNVSDYVRYPAVLSVVAVRPADRDEAVKEGRGYSMALTMPTSMKMAYIYEDDTQETRTYNLTWKTGTDHTGDYAGGLIQYGSNTFAPIRTSNTEQYLQLVAWVDSYEVDGETEADHKVLNGYYEKAKSSDAGALQIVSNDYAIELTESQIKLSDVEAHAKDNYTPHVGDYVKLTEGYKDYGTRTISKLYQMMLGTEEYPYLISNALDLEHIAFTAEDSTISNAADDYGDYPDLYDHWYSPVTTANRNTDGKVYFKLISNVDMSKHVEIENGIATVVPAGNNLFTAITSMKDNDYGNGITFKGIEIDGDDYAIVNFNGAQFIETLDADSAVENLIFKDAVISSDSADAALIGTNDGTVDGLMLMNTSAKTVSAANGNAAGIAAINNGTIRNSVAQSSITGADYIGGIAAENYGTIELSVSDSQLTGTSGTLGIGGIVGKNYADAVVEKSFSLGSVTGAADTTYVGGFVGENAGTIEDSYTRTEVDGVLGKGGSFVGLNSEGGSISNAYAAGKTELDGVRASSTGSAFAGADNGTLHNAWADKALLNSDTYMLAGDAEVTENIIAGTCFDSNAFDYCESGVNAYPVLKDIMTAGPEETTEGTAQASEYEWIKYKLLKAYSTVSTVTIDSKHAHYVDKLAPVSNPVTTVPPESGYKVTPTGSVSSGSGTVLAETITSVAQKIGAGLNVQDDLKFAPSFSFTYTVSGTAENPNFNGGTGTEREPYIIQDHNGYTAESSFAGLAYFGKATDAVFVMADDVSYDGADLPAPITKLNGTLNGAGHTVNDLTIANNTALIGKMDHGTVKNLGLAGVRVIKAPAEDSFCYGLLAAEADGATIQNVYAVGEIKIEEDAASASQPVHVGGLVGHAKDSTVSNVVTSGYISNKHVDTESADPDFEGEYVSESTVGGIFGLMDGGLLSAAESTAYVFGDNFVGGIAGREVNGAVQNVIFAGTVADTVKSTYGSTDTDTAAISQIIGSAEENTVSGLICYDRQLALFEDSDYADAGVSTRQIVKGTVTGFDASGFTKDGDGQYYPNPVTIPSNASNAYKAGLNFALARINVTLAGDEGALNCYDRIFVTTPVVNLENDTVSVTEDRTRFDVKNEYMLADGEYALVPNGGSAQGFTGVLAQLNCGADASFGGNANSIYRYLEPEIVRVIDVDYVLVDGTTGTNFGDTTKVGLMLRPVMEGTLKISSNAVTSIAEDADTTVGEGDYTVKFKKIVVSGGGISVDTMLPEGYSYTVAVGEDADGATTPYYSGRVDDNDSTKIVLGDTDHVKIIVTITDAEPGWGLRRVSGGLH